MSVPDFVRKNAPDFGQDRVVVMVQAVYDHDGDGATGDLLTTVYDMTCESGQAEGYVGDLVNRKWVGEDALIFENRVESRWETPYRA
jgi:hypothetical protein